MNNQFILYSGSCTDICLVSCSLHFILSQFLFLCFRWRIHLEKGIFKKESTCHSIGRIQSVNTKQNIIQQVLDVVSLEIDTAGTVGKELKIHALEKSMAGELQN